jgi:hypothetical protein
MKQPFDVVMVEWLDSSRRANSIVKSLKILRSLLQASPADGPMASIG